MRACLIVLAAALLSGLPATARAEVEFAGYIVRIGDLRFMLADRPAGEVSRWLGVGQTFAGHTVIEFDWKAETLVVEKLGERVRLPLKPGRAEGYLPSLEVAEEMARRSVKLGDAILNVAGGYGILFMDLEAAQKRLDRQEQALGAVRETLRAPEPAGQARTPERRAQLEAWEESLAREVVAVQALVEEKQRALTAAQETPVAGPPAAPAAEKPPAPAATPTP
jgi:hypothetical protein